MQSWPGPARKENHEREPLSAYNRSSGPHARRTREKLWVRVALLVLLAQYVALADAGLPLFLARQAVPLVVVSAMAAFAAAYKFFDGLIEEELQTGRRPVSVDRP